MDIKALRDEWMVSQEELALITGIPRDRIAKWEQGKSKPKTEDALLLQGIDRMFKRLLSEHSEAIGTAHIINNIKHGFALQKYLSDHKLSEDDLAKRLGVDEMRIKMFERGLFTFDEDGYKPIWELLNIDPSMEKVPRLRILENYNGNKNIDHVALNSFIEDSGAKYGTNPATNRAENQDLLYMKIIKKFETYQPIPVYDVDIAASNLELYDDKSALPEDFYYIPEFSGCRAFNVYSDSMEPLIPKGSRIFARRIDDWKTVLEYGQVYAVGLIDGRRFIKYVKKAESKDDFRLVSENDFYDDFDIPKIKVRSIWLIDGWMNKHTQSTFFVLKDNKKP